MSEQYRFRGKDLEDLTREELIEALKQALDLLWCADELEALLASPAVREDEGKK